MKNFLKLCKLIEPAKKAGYHLTIRISPHGVSCIMWESLGDDVTGEPVAQHLSVVDGDDLRKVINEILDIIGRKSLPAGENNCVVLSGDGIRAEDKIFSVTKKDDCTYVWTDDEIGELLRDDILDKINENFEEDGND